MSRETRRVWGGSVSDVVWAGRGPLTEWPERDWFVLLRDDSYQPIWDRQPMTTSMWLARLMTGRDGRDDGLIRTVSVSPLSNVDVQARMDAAWARVKALMPLTQVQQRVEQTTVEAPLKPKPASADELVREVALFDSMAGDDVAICSTTNKIRHKSKLWALHHRNRLAALPSEYHPEQLEAYKCKWCGNWHVGHRI